jgi:vitamin B12 transporter
MLSSMLPSVHAPYDIPAFFARRRCLHHQKASNNQIFLKIAMGAFNLFWIVCSWAIIEGSLFYHVPHANAQDSQSPEQAAAITLDTITVTAEKLTDLIRNHPQQVTTVDRQEILERNFMSVEETLNSMAGVEVRPSAGIGSRISIRGSGRAGGVLVLLNGRPLNTSQYGSVDLSTIPIDIVKSVTVFKPPVPVWLGPGASEGAISIVTHDFQPEPEGAEKQKKITRLKLSGGSFGRCDTGVSYTAPLTDGSLMLTAAGGHLDGKRTNADRDKGDLSIHWNRGGMGAVRYELNGRYYISEHGSSGPTDNPTPDARQRYEKGSMDFQADGPAGDRGDYTLNAYADRVDLQDRSQSGSTSDLRDIKWGLKADTDWSGAEETWALRVGGILERDEVEHTLSGEHDRVTAGAHAQYDRHFKTLIATLGLRGDHTSDFEFNPGASAGLSFEATRKLLIKGNAGYQVSVPNFGQLYQPSHGSIDQVRGNPDLSEEKVASYDLGLEYRSRKNRVFQATLFRTDTRDLIVYRRGADRVYQPVNIDKAWRHGLELTVKYAWDMGVSMDLDYILQDSQNQETRKELAYTPRNTFKATVKYTLPGWKTRLETKLQYSDQRYSEAEARESEKLHAYTTVDLKLLQPFSVGRTSCEGFIDFYNLFDRDFENHFGYPDDGFRFVAGLKLTL